MEFDVYVAQPAVGGKTLYERYTVLANTEHGALSQVAEDLGEADSEFKGLIGSAYPKYPIRTVVPVTTYEVV